MKAVIAIGLALGLGACATTGAGTTGSSSAIFAKIQQYTVAYCKFEPAISSVIEIVATLGGPGAIAGEAIIEQTAKSICAAVVPVKTTKVEGWGGLTTLVDYQIAQNAPSIKVQPGSKAKGTPPKVNGVTVHGKFVK